MANAVCDFLLVRFKLLARRRSPIPSENRLTRLPGLSRRRGVSWRQLSEPFELGAAEGGSKGERARGRMPLEQPNRRCRKDTPLRHRAPSAF